MRRAATIALLAAVTFGCADPPPDPPRRVTVKVGRTVPPPPPPPPPRALTPEERWQRPVYRYPARPEPGAPMRDPRVRPRIIEQVEPEYTEEARKARIGGIVILELVIEPDGRVSSGKVLKPLPMGLTQKAIDAVEKWRFEPALDGGQPVRAFHNVTVNFRPK